MSHSPLVTFTKLLQEGCISTAAVEKITKVLVEESSKELCQYIGRHGPNLDKFSNFLNAVQYCVKQSSSSFSHLQDVGLLMLMSAVFEKTLVCLSIDGPSDNLQTIIEIEIETVNVLAESDPSAKSQVFLSLCPYLLDLLLHGLLNFQTKMEVLKATNMLLEQCRTSYKDKFLQDDNFSKKVTDFANLIKTIGDYEFQVCQLECLMRLFPRKSRSLYASKVFTDKQMLSEFLEIKDQEFEVDCRLFLNLLNGRTENPSKGVFSIPCVTACVGKKQLRQPSDEGYGEFWVDFNTGSDRLTLFCEQDSLLSQNTPLDDGEWETVAVYKTDILKYDCSVFEGEFVLKIWLKSPVCQIYPSQHQDVTDNTITIHFLELYENHIISAVDSIFNFTEKRKKVSTVEKPLCIILKEVQAADSQSGFCEPPVKPQENVVFGSQESVSRRRKVSVPSVPMKIRAITPVSTPVIPPESKPTEGNRKEFTTPQSVRSKTLKKVKTPVVTVTAPADKSAKKRNKMEKKENIDDTNTKEEDLVIPESQPIDKPPAPKKGRQKVKNAAKSKVKDAGVTQTEPKISASLSLVHGKVNKSDSKKQKDVNKAEASQKEKQKTNHTIEDIDNLPETEVETANDVQLDSSKAEESANNVQLECSKAKELNSIPDSCNDSEHSVLEEAKLTISPTKSILPAVKKVSQAEDADNFQKNTEVDEEATSNSLPCKHISRKGDSAKQKSGKKKVYADVDKSLKELCDLDNLENDIESDTGNKKSSRMDINPNQETTIKNIENDQHSFCDVDEKLKELDSVESTGCVKLSKDQKKHKTKNNRNVQKCKSLTKANTKSTLKSNQGEKRSLRKRNKDKNTENETTYDDNERPISEDNNKENEHIEACESVFNDVEAEKVPHTEQKIDVREVKKDMKVLNNDNLSKEYNSAAKSKKPNRKSPTNSLKNVPSDSETDSLVIINDDDYNVRRFKHEEGIAKSESVQMLCKKTETLEKKTKDCTKSQISVTNHGKVQDSPGPGIENQAEQKGNKKNSAVDNDDPPKHKKTVVPDVNAIRQSSLAIKNKKKKSKEPTHVSPNCEIKGKRCNKSEPSVNMDLSFVNRIEKMKCADQTMNFSRSMSRKENMIFEWSYSRCHSRVRKNGWASHGTSIKQENEEYDPYDFASQEFEDSLHFDPAPAVANCKPKKKEIIEKSKSKSKKEKVAVKVLEDSPVLLQMDLTTSKKSKTGMLNMSGHKKQNKKLKSKTKICQDENTKKWFRKPIVEDNMYSNIDCGYSQADETTPSPESSATTEEAIEKALSEDSSQEKKTRCILTPAARTPQVVSGRTKFYSPLDISIIKTPESHERIKLEVQEESYSDEKYTGKTKSKRRPRRQKKSVQYVELSNSNTELSEDDTSYISTKIFDTSLLGLSHISNKSEKSWILERKENHRKKKTPKTYKSNKPTSRRDVCVVESQTEDLHSVSSDGSPVTDVTSKSFPESVFSTHIDTPVMKVSKWANAEERMHPDVLIRTPYTPQKSAQLRQAEEEDIDVFQTQENLILSLNMDGNDSTDEAYQPLKRLLHQGINSVLGDSGFVSGPSSEVRPRMSNLKRKYADSHLSESQETECEEEEEEQNPMEQSTLVPKKLFKLDPSAYLAKQSSPVGTSIVSDVTDLDIYSQTGGSNMDPFMATFGSAIQKHVVERQQFIEKYIKHTHREAQKHFNDYWIEQQQIQSNLTDDFHAKMNNELSALEEDITRLKEAEQQTEEMYKSQKKLLCQNHESQTARLASMKSIECRHREKSKRMKGYSRIQDDLQEKLRREMSILQRKLVKDAQKQEYMNVRNRLQKMF